MRKSTHKPARIAVPPWSFPVAVADIPDSGRHFDLVADAPTRAAVATLAAVVAVPHLVASIDVTRHGVDGLLVVGQVTATVVQNCVVTLEPIENEIAEPIDLVFLPAGSGVAADGESGDAPERMVDGTIDLAALATEFLILAIDPYPRKPDAVFEPPPDRDEEARPFAALAALRKKEGGPAQ